MLILIAHGSRDPLWRASLEGLTQKVGAGLPSEEVRLAFMQFGGPTLPEVVREAVVGGSNHLRLLPLFMASAGHVDKDIKPLVEELSQAHPEATLELLAPVGENPLLPGLLLEILTEPPTGG